ncbi:hypothetical protein L208DRAFT_1390521 [Tricholoma matsutake]|nr:hypothetical protein L208DRAFT_1390521 [Tricholoma matsutake 945]
MSPTLLLSKRDSCNVFGTNCNQGIRPSTYVIVVSIAVVVFIFATGFFMRRRRMSRLSASRPIQPEFHPQHPLVFQYNHPPPAPTFFEPAPPYDVFKAPSPSPSPQPASGHVEIPLLHSQAPRHPAPLQYPPPSYTPA